MSGFTHRPGGLGQQGGESTHRPGQFCSARVRGSAGSKEITGEQKNYDQDLSTRSKTSWVEGFLTCNLFSNRDEGSQSSSDADTQSSSDAAPKRLDAAHALASLFYD